MQIFKFQRRSCKLSFLFAPRHQSAPRACSQAITDVKISDASRLWGLTFSFSLSFLSWWLYCIEIKIHAVAFSISEDPTISEPRRGFVFERRTWSGRGIFALLRLVFEQIFGQIVFLRVKTLSNTNAVTSRLIKRENAHLRLMCVSEKTSVVKLPIIFFVLCMPRFRKREGNSE